MSFQRSHWLYLYTKPYRWGCLRCWDSRCKHCLFHTSNIILNYISRLSPVPPQPPSPTLVIHPTTPVLLHPPLPVLLPPMLLHPPPLLLLPPLLLHPPSLLLPPPLQPQLQPKVLRPQQVTFRNSLPAVRFWPLTPWIIINFYSLKWEVLLPQLSGPAERVSKSTTILTSTTCLPPFLVRVPFNIMPVPTLQTRIRTLASRLATVTRKKPNATLLHKWTLQIRWSPWRFFLGLFNDCWFERFCHVA